MLFRQLLHALVTGVVAHPVTEQPVPSAVTMRPRRFIMREQTVLEALVEVPHRAQLLRRPRRLHPALVVRETLLEKSAASRHSNSVSAASIPT